MLDAEEIARLWIFDSDRVHAGSLPLHSFIVEHWWRIFGAGTTVRGTRGIATLEAAVAKADGLVLLADAIEALRLEVDVQWMTLLLPEDLRRGRLPGDVTALSFFIWLKVLQVSRIAHTLDHSHIGDLAAGAQYTFLPR